MISIIIVTFNSEDFIKQCLDSIKNKCKDIDYEIIIVDNDSQDNTKKVVYKHYPEIRLIRNARNIGFAAANNKGIERSRGEYIYLLNPDTYMENNAPKIMMEFLKDNPGIACVGSRLEYFDNRLQLSCRKFPNLINVFFGRKSLFRYLFPNNPISRKYMMEDMDYSKKQKVDWVMGASIMIKKSVLDEVGLFDEQFFLFVEDTDLCYRITNAGYDIYYLPDAIVKHFHGGSVINRFNKSQINHNISMYKYFKKHLSSKNMFIPFLYIAILFRLIFISFSEGIRYFKRNYHINDLFESLLIRGKKK